MNIIESGQGFTASIESVPLLAGIIFFKGLLSYYIVRDLIMWIAGPSIDRSVARVGARHLEKYGKLPTQRFVFWLLFYLYMIVTCAAVLVLRFIWWI